MEEELEKVRASIASFVRKAKCPKSKITADEREALASLRNNDDIVILEADKGNATVVLDREVYERKAKDILGQKPVKLLKKDPTTSEGAETVQHKFVILC